MNHQQYSYKDVLCPKKRISHVSEIIDIAVKLGYPFFLWNDRIYKTDGNNKLDTGCTIDNLS